MNLKLSTEYFYKHLTQNVNPYRRKTSKSTNSRPNAIGIENLKSSFFLFYFSTQKIPKNHLIWIVDLQRKENFIYIKDIVHFAKKIGLY